jgi:hypothetical protein
MAKMARNRRWGRAIGWMRDKRRAQRKMAAERRTIPIEGEDLSWLHELLSVHVCLPVFRSPRCF